MGSMTRYVRPEIVSPVFRDEAGEIIPYGAHWRDRGGTPPEASYSVVRNPERFAPLHDVATALIEHLSSTHEVTIEEGRQAVDGLLRPPTPEETVRAVRLTPRRGTSAPVVIVLTDFPGVHLQAGVLFRERYPSCGCDACDEWWEPVADELERTVLTVVGGGFTERVSEPRRATWRYDAGRGLALGMGQTVSYGLRADDGRPWRSGESRAEDVPPAMLERARTRLCALSAVDPDGGWAPWPARTPEGEGGPAATPPIH